MTKLCLSSAMPSNNNNSNRDDIHYVNFLDKRLILFVLVVIIGLVLSANLLLSVGKTSEVHDRLRVSNDLVLSIQEFKIQYDVSRAAINTFMFLGSDETWEIAERQTKKLYEHAEKLAKIDSASVNIQQQLVDDLKIKVNKYILNLSPLRGIRQDARGVIEGVVNSTESQAAQNYQVTASLGNAIQILIQEDDSDKDLILMLQSAQNRWLRIITEFRALLLLRTSRTQQATLAHVEQFQQQWSEILDSVGEFDILLQEQISTVDKNQKAWINSLPQVINIHLGKRWRRDLRYMDENLTPIGDQILSSLNSYQLDVADYIKATTSEILELEKKNIIWIFIIMGLIVVFSLTMLLIYTRLLAAQQRKRMDVERINAMKTEFLSTISHELRTPLNAIIGFSQLLEMNLDDTLTPQQKSNVNEINIAGNHLLHLVNEILDLSAIDSGNINLNMQATNLCDALGEAISLSSTMAEKHHVSINNQTQTSAICSVNADPVRLRQVLLNILSNAIKYNVEGGSVTISIEADDMKFRIRIKDTGIGISKQNIEKLFQPFERLGQPTEIEGAGIGLMVTKELVESMNGHIDVNSKPNKGTTFWIELPAA